jgi:hypothetical protein
MDEGAFRPGYSRTGATAAGLDGLVRRTLDALRTAVLLAEVKFGCL